MSKIDPYKLIKKFDLKNGDILFCDNSIRHSMLATIQSVSKDVRKFPDITVLFVDHVERVVKKELSP